jgi:hypothetical protein
MGCQSSLFGASAQYIKVSGGDFIAIDGANTVDRLTVSDLRMPYKQLLRSRVILKSGQTNYLLNHLGLGDNATFLCIKAVYNQKSVIEEDNYIKWSFYDDMAKVHTMAQMMVLTGNSTNRIKQLYLSNPSEKYPVSLDVMVGVIDDTYQFFNDSVNQSSTSFVGLNYTDIQTHITGQSFKINDKGTPVRPLIYIEIVNIETIEKTGSILIIDDASYGTVFLQFLTEYDAYQAHSILNYIIENPDIDINEIPTGDNEDPIIYFYDQVGQTGDFIALNGNSIDGPYNTSMGLTFSTGISLLDYGTTASGGTSSIIDRSKLIDLLVDKITDNRDGTMSMQPSNIVINSASASISTILLPGTYSVTFNFSDIANNTLDGVHMDLTITT